MNVGDELTCKIESNNWLTQNMKYEIVKIFFDKNYGKCISIIDNVGNETKYSINKVNGKNYETFFNNIKYQRRKKLQKIIQNTTEEKL